MHLDRCPPDSGHTGSWIGPPELLTDCYDENGTNTNLPNLLDPTRASTFEFLEELFRELATVFPERFLHLGGDEVSDYITECWCIFPYI